MGMQMSVFFVGGQIKRADRLVFDESPNLISGSGAAVNERAVNILTLLFNVLT